MLYRNKVLGVKTTSQKFRKPPETWLGTCVGNHCHTWWFNVWWLSIDFTVVRLADRHSQLECWMLHWLDPFPSKFKVKEHVIEERSGCSTSYVIASGSDLSFPLSFDRSRPPCCLGLFFCQHTRQYFCSISFLCLLLQQNVLISLLQDWQFIQLRFFFPCFFFCQKEDITFVEKILLSTSFGISLALRTSTVSSIKLTSSPDLLQVGWGQSTVYAQVTAFPLIRVKNIRILSPSQWRIDNKSEQGTLITTGITASLLIQFNRLVISKSIITTL